MFSNIRPAPRDIRALLPRLRYPHHLLGSALGDSPERPSAPEQRHDLSHRTPSRLSPFSKNRLILKPSRLTLGAAAATVAAVAGIAIGATTGSTTGTGTPAALNRAGVSKTTSHPALPHASASQAPTTHHDTAAHHAASGPAPAPRARRRAHQAHIGRHRAVVAKPAAPYLIYDSVIPSALPANHVAASYATGPFAASPSQLAGRKTVVWIDTNGSDPAASALDVEPGDATPSVAASWARQRLSEHPHAVARIYTNISEWAAVKASVAGLPHKMQARVRWWIADPTGVAHLVPGSDATQWYWGSSYDISTATPRF